MIRVLIAERDRAIAELMKTAVCRAMECEAKVAHDRESASNMLQAHAFDVVLLDIGMYSSGLDTLTSVRDGNQNSEVIALTTGIVAAPLLKTLAAADVFAVVAKPFDVEQLVALVLESTRTDRQATPNQPRVYRTAGGDPTHD